MCCVLDKKTERKEKESQETRKENGTQGTQGNEKRKGGGGNTSLVGSSRLRPGFKRVFITNVKGTFLGMSESEEASKRR